MMRHKEAVSAETLNNVVRQVVKPKFIPLAKLNSFQKATEAAYNSGAPVKEVRRAVKQYSESPLGLNGPVSYAALTPDSPQSVVEAATRIKNKKYINRNKGVVHSVKGSINAARREYGGIGGGLDYGMTGLSGTDHRTINNVTNMHELFETQVSKKTFDPLYQSARGHLGPEVLLKENNILQTLPESERKTKEVFGKMRESEHYDIGRTLNLPENWNQRRYSRHAIKRMASQYSKNFKKEVASYKNASLLDIMNTIINHKDIVTGAIQSLPYVKARLNIKASPMEGEKIKRLMAKVPNEVKTLYNTYDEASSALAQSGALL